MDSNDDWIVIDDPNLENAFRNKKWKAQIQKRIAEADDIPIAWEESFHTSEEPINFKYCSGRYSDLYDSEKHSEIMREIFAEIDSNLESIIQTGLWNDSSIDG